MCSAINTTTHWHHWHLSRSRAKLTSRTSLQYLVRHQPAGQMVRGGSRLVVAWCVVVFCQWCVTLDLQSSAKLYLPVRTFLSGKTVKVLPMFGLGGQGLILLMGMCVDTYEFHHFNIYHVQMAHSHSHRDRLRSRHTWDFRGQHRPMPVIVFTCWVVVVHLICCIPALACMHSLLTRHLYTTLTQ